MCTEVLAVKNNINKECKTFSLKNCLHSVSCEAGEALIRKQ